MIAKGPTSTSSTTTDTRATGGASAADRLAPTRPVLVDDAVAISRLGTAMRTTDAGRGAARLAAPATVGTTSSGAMGNPTAVGGGGPAGASGTAGADAAGDAQAALGSTPLQDAPDVMGQVERMPDPAIAGAGGWDSGWNRVFAEELQLAPADVAFLAQGGFSDAELQQIATELRAVDAVQVPVAGTDAGDVASADGPLPGDVMPQGQPGSGTAWNQRWANRFKALMTRMGLPEAKIAEQLRTMEGTPTTEEQLQLAFDQMREAVGAWSSTWEQKFSVLMDELDISAAEKRDALQQLATSGMDRTALQEVYDGMSAQVPAWDAAWEKKFTDLGLPEELVKELAGAELPEDGLQANYDKFVETRLAYSKDGRLARLEEAGADAATKWGIMLEGVKGEEFDKAVEQIHGANVPLWKTVANFAFNLIPGTYALQYLTGGEWITGNKIDRSNPLNIIGAVASGFAGVNLVRGAVSTVRAAGGMWQAAHGVKGAMMGVSMLDDGAIALTKAGNLGSGTLAAINEAKIGAALLNNSRGMFQLKAFVGSFARFGEVGRIAGVSRGFEQGARLAAGAAAMRGSGANIVIDKATRAQVYDKLIRGGSIDDALAGVSRSTGSAKATISSNAEIARLFNNNGFLQKGGFWKLPFRNDATIKPVGSAIGGGPNAARVFELGRGVNFGTRGGLALGLGATQGANLATNGAALASTAHRMGVAVSNPMTAGNEAIALKTADWARRLGVSGGGAFRTLGQLDLSSRAARTITGAVQRGGEGAYRARAGVMGFLGNNTMLNFGVAGAYMGGMGGRQLQPAWELVKEDPGMLVGASRHEEERRAAAEAADREQRELEELYRQQQAAGEGEGAPGTTGPTTSTPDAGTGTGGLPTPQVPATGTPGAIDPATQPQVVGTAPGGGQLIFDPKLGVVYDGSTGEAYDPATGAPLGNVVTGTSAPAAGVATTPASPVAGPGQPAVTVPNTAMPAPAGQATATPASPGTGVTIDPQTGFYVDQASGLMADPATGNVYDPRTGQLVGNVATGAGTTAP